MKHSLAEIEKLIQHLDYLIADVGSLTTQLKQAEEINHRLLAQNIAMSQVLHSLGVTKHGGSIH